MNPTSIRFSDLQHGIVLKAAEKRHLPLGEFVRTAAMEAALLHRPGLYEAIRKLADSFRETTDRLPVSLQLDPADFRVLLRELDVSKPYPETFTLSVAGGSIDIEPRRR